MIALARQDGCGFALVDGDLDSVGPIRTGGQIAEDTWFANGSAPVRDTVTIAFDGSLHVVPVESMGCGWAFIAFRPERPGRPRPRGLTRAPVMPGCAAPDQAAKPGHNGGSRAFVGSHMVTGPCWFMSGAVAVSAAPPSSKPFTTARTTDSPGPAGARACPRAELLS